jgi:type II secretory pathway component PulJ
MSLIECICYLALCAILSGVLFKWWVRSHEHIAFMQRKADGATQARIVYQLIRRDCAQASPFVDHWNVAADSLRFQIHHDHIAYSLKAGALQRKYQKSGAKKGAKSLLARGIKTVSWQITQNDQMVTQLTIHLRWENDPETLWHFPLKTGMRS